jgi:hypothetical protein
VVLKVLTHKMDLASRGKKQISRLKSALPTADPGDLIAHRSMPKPITSFGGDSVVVPCANCCAL